VGESITHEIDLRPEWRRWAHDLDPRTRSRALVFGGSAALIAILVFAWAGSREPETGSPPPKIAKPVDAPIVIHATREPEAPAPTAEKRVEASPSIDKGTLKVTSEPSVWVYDGDARLGRTPLEIKLEPGRHEIRYVDKAKDLEVKSKVEIKSGQTSTRDLNFGVGTLRIEAPEGTKAFVGTRSIGEGPFGPIELLEGRHRLKLKKGSEVVEEWIDVPASRTIAYRVHFAD
jgi:hypothetical protein